MSSYSSTSLKHLIYALATFSNVRILTVYFLHTGMLKISHNLHLTGILFRLDVDQGGLTALVRLSNGDMRKSLNILQVSLGLYIFIGIKR